MTTPEYVEDGHKLNFYCFAKPQLRRLRETWEKLSIVAREPDLLDVSGAITTPGISRGKRVSGVCDRENTPVPLSARIHRKDDRQDNELEACDLINPAEDTRSAYYLGRGMSHYGHFILETLCRAWAWPRFGEGRVAVLQTGVPQFARELYALIPGLLEKLEVVKAPTRFDRMLVPGPAFVVASTAHLEFKRMCERMAERVVVRHAPITEQPLYLSRAGLNSETRRTIEGEITLEGFLEREGFLVVRPETLPISEQIEVVNRHKWIISPLGSACHTRLFSLGETHQITISPDHFTPNYLLCDYLCEGGAHYINALSTPNIGTKLRLPNFLEPVVLDGSRLTAVLKQLGLIRQSASFEHHSSNLKEYKLRWIAIARLQATKRPQDEAGLLKAIDEVMASMAER